MPLLTYYNGQNSQHWPHQMPVRNTHTLLIGTENSIATLDYRLVVSYKTKHTLKDNTILSSAKKKWTFKPWIDMEES